MLGLTSAKKFWLSIIGLFLFISSNNLQAHPHVFIDAQVKVYFDASGVKGYKITWTFDKMFSELMIDEFDDDVDDQFNEQEQKLIYQKAFSNLKKFDYFTKILIDGKPFEIKYITNFKAQIHDEVMTYSFFIPCPIAISTSEKSVKIYTYDESYYMDVSLTNSAISFANSSTYNISYQVEEDDNKRYYFDQINPFVLKLSLRKK